MPELDELFEMLQRTVRNGTVGQLKSLQVHQALDRFQTGLGNPRTADIELGELFEVGQSDCRPVVCSGSVQGQAFQFREAPKLSDSRGSRIVGSEGQVPQARNFRYDRQVLVASHRNIECFQFAERK